MASAGIIMKTLLAFECFSLTLGGERVNQVKVLKTTILPFFMTKVSILVNISLSYIS